MPNRYSQSDRSAWWPYIQANIFELSIAVFSLIAAVLYIGYDTYLISKTGQTLGKKWLSMRVANLENGSTPSVQTSLVRSAVLVACRLVLSPRAAPMGAAAGSTGAG